MRGWRLAIAGCGGDYPPPLSCDISQHELRYNSRYIFTEVELCFRNIEAHEVVGATPTGGAPDGGAKVVGGSADGGAVAACSSKGISSTSSCGLSARSRAMATRS